MRTSPRGAPVVQFGGHAVNLFHIAFIGIIVFTTFTRLWRLDQPDNCYFDEVYFPSTGAEILRGDKEAWEYYGHENTHPPLSKLAMAVGQGIYGHKSYGNDPDGNHCWGDEPDAPKRTDSDWLYDPVGWRMPGALAGIGAVMFMFLLARALFRSDIAGLAASFLLAADGLAFAHARIGTPDSMVLFFIVGTLYFTVTNRWVLAGIFLGAGAATKWNVAFIILPVVLYFIWRFYVRWREAAPDRELMPAERVLAIGAGLIGLGVAVAVPLYVVEGHLSGLVVGAAGALGALGLFVIIGGVIAILTDPVLRSKERARVYSQALFSFPLFFLAVPFAVYMATYIPMFAADYDLDHWWFLSDESYKFHSSLEASHGWQSSWWQWPINARPVFFEVRNYAKIYNLGNPIVFWMSLPALGFTLWQGLKFIRVRVNPGSVITVWGRLGEREAALVFTFFCWLALWLFWATNPRTLFFYHYIPAFVFAVLALGYMVHWLWHESPVAGSRQIALLFLGVAGVTFVYFYPHLAFVDVPPWLDEQYYWFSSWR
ncbi:MAG TPA: phospholipid carrier-dependent glycosyltransferase [Dehalococcoidia bacterium]|nr:phospholipid carrier-dependent glycosyltransferase [Dehalococcoidia bacterium]